MKYIINKIIPKSLRVKLKLSRIYLNREAKKLALTTKRLDICAAQIAHLLHLSKYNSLKGQTCLEIGSGWTLSHSIIFYLLGAERIICTDISPIAAPESIYRSIHSSIIHLIRDILSPFEEHHLLRKRLNYLLSIPKFNFEVLKGLGIEYLSPLDFSTFRLNTPVDFIFSNSVFELIPFEDLDMILKNLYAELIPNGIMIHCIHLEDHKDIISAPFEFLSISSKDYSRIHESSRGNRIRKSDWCKIFEKFDNAEITFLYEWLRLDKEIPKIIDPSISYENEKDIRTSHIGVLIRKSG